MELGTLLKRLSRGGLTSADSGHQLDLEIAIMAFLLMSVLPSGLTDLPSLLSKREKSAELQTKCGAREKATGS